MTSLRSRLQGSRLGHCLDQGYMFQADRQTPAPAASDGTETASPPVATPREVIEKLSAAKVHLRHFRQLGGMSSPLTLLLLLYLCDARAAIVRRSNDNSSQHFQYVRHTQPAGMAAG